jgi:hypothetical protein
MENRYKKLKTCLYCGATFMALKDCKSRNQLYCNQTCYGKSLEGKPATDSQRKGLAHGWDTAKGRPSKYKGVPRTEEAKRNISNARKGKPLSEDHKKSLHKPHPSGAEENHWNWQGGVTPENHKIRSSAELEAWRKSVFERDNYTCQICNQHGGELNAHHINAFAWDEESRDNVINGVTLCKQCHKKADKRNRDIKKITEYFQGQSKPNGHSNTEDIGNPSSQV